MSNLMAWDAYGLMHFLGGANDKATPRSIGRVMGIPPKRVVALCEKWANKGWYEYGVSVDTGWLTEAGHERLKQEYERRQETHV